MRRRMIALQRALEGGASNHGSSNFGLASIIIIHQIVGLLGLFLAAIDPPANDAQAGQDDGSADTDNDANNSVASLGRHVAVLAVLTGGKARRRGRGSEGFARHGCRNSLLVGGGDDLGDGLDDGLDRRAGLGVVIIVVG